MIRDYIRTLVWANQYRRKQGLFPLLKLPKDTGKSYTGRVDNCPIARATQPLMLFERLPIYVDRMAGRYDRWMEARIWKERNV